MPDRVLRANILTSDSVNLLGWPAEVFYRRLMSIVDDYGRYDARPSILRGQLYSLKLDKVSDADVVKWLGECSKAGLISVYQVHGKEYLEILKFGQRLRAMKSRFPDSAGNGGHMSADAGKQRPESETESESLSETESKQKKNVAPAKPSLKKVSKSPSLEETEPYWQALIKAWFDFNEKHFQDKPSFKDRDPKFFKSIIELLKKRAATKSIEWTEYNAVASLNYFFGIAFQDPWLSKNFLLENLLKQFDKIYMNQNKKAVGAKSAEPVDVVTQIEIDYLVSRHIEGAMTFDQVKPEHFDFLHAAGSCTITEAAMAEARRGRTEDFRGSNHADKIRLMQAYQENKETVETKIDLPNLLILAKRIAVFFYIDNCKADATKSIAS